MKKSIVISFVWLTGLVVLLSACETGILDRTNKDEVEFGELANMKLLYLDTVLIGEYHHGKDYPIDLDQDGQDDFNISSLIWGSPGIGMIPTSGISCLHEGAQFLGYYRNDTTFKNVMRREFQENNIIEVYETITFSCYRMEEDDSIFHIGNDIFHLADYSRGDQFTEEDIFKCDSLTLATYWTRSMRDARYVGEDTVIYSQAFYNNDCFSFPQNEIRYIGVRLEGKRPRLGWIKLSVSEYFRVFILEAAIQE